MKFHFCKSKAPPSWTLFFDMCISMVLKSAKFIFSGFFAIFLCDFFDESCLLLD